MPNGAWDMQCLQQYFNQEDIQAIVQIKPSTRHEEDFVAWFTDKWGMFTIRGAYRLGLD
jgi:predicted 3-demethylubiquinone-9 3-methyltransferase (glyoxalase superfamily)